MKKTNNKGFSLVELIVVIAIMAVLMVVIAPQLLRYVDKTRIQRDNSAIAEIANAAKIAMAEQDVYDYVGGLDGDKAEIKIVNGTYTFEDDATVNALEAELYKTISETVSLNSNKYQNDTVTITVAIASDNVKVTASGMYNTDGNKETTDTTF